MHMYFWRGVRVFGMGMGVEDVVAAAPAVAVVIVF